MHICFVTSAFGRNDSLIVYRQGKSLVEDGHKVTYALCDGKPEEMKFGIRMLSVGEKQKSLRDRILVNNRQLRKFVDSFDADIYQISEPELLQLALHLKRRGKKVVFNLREYYPDYYARKFKNTIARKLTFYLCEKYFRYVAKRIDAVFSCMPEMHDYIIKVMPCKYFVDVANFPIVNSDFSLSYEDYCKRDNVINYFGSIYTISCQETVIEALPSFPNLKYVLAGVFYQKSYQEKLMAMPGWSQVEFINGFDRKDLPIIINRSVIGNVLRDFTKTETPEGSYSIIKIFETMEAAVPIIIPRIKLYEEMINKYHCGICVDPYSVEEVKSAIKYLLENKQEAYQMGQNGRKAVIEEFSWNSQYKNYHQVLRQLFAE